ncbi:MAG: hypothetical protein EHM42_03100, partial [Planctomycetaceae bacterium]
MPSLFQNCRLALVVTGLVLAVWGRAPARADEPLALGFRRELFVDQTLIHRLERVRFQIHEPRDEGQVLAFDKPWEGPFSGYVTVLRDGDRFRLYYRGRPTAGRDGDRVESTCLAESNDGIHWTKPGLGLFTVDGTRDNNCVLADMPPFPHNFSPLIDTRPGCLSEERYKALAGVLGEGLFAFVSADGIHWRKMRDTPIFGIKPIDTPGFVHAFDSQNVAFWSEAEQKYLCYFRSYENGMRRIYRSVSSDFRNWSKPGRMEYTAFGQPAPIEHMYTNQTSPYFRA